MRVKFSTVQTECGTVHAQCSTIQQVHYIQCNVGIPPCSVLTGSILQHRYSAVQCAAGQVGPTVPPQGPESFVAQLTQVVNGATGLELEEGLRLGFGLGSGLHWHVLRQAALHCTT